MESDLKLMTPVLSLRTKMFHIGVVNQDIYSGLWRITQGTRVEDQLHHIFQAVVKKKKKPRLMQQNIFVFSTEVLSII